MFMAPIRRLAVATKGAKEDLAAVKCLAAFAQCCDVALIAEIVKKDPDLADTPPLTARLIALITAVPDQDLHTQIGALLSKIVHTSPDLARGILESVLSSTLAAETPDQRVALIQTLRTCLRTVDCKKALPDWPIDKGMLSNMSRVCL
jgi:hypothetical protein